MGQARFRWCVKTVAPVALIAVLGGCSWGGLPQSDQVYFHDAELLKRVTATRDKFKATNAEKSVSDAMLANLDAGVAAEKKILEQVQKLRFQGELANLEGLTWEDIRACAKASRCPSSQPPAPRIARITQEMAVKTAEIATLTDLIADDPDGRKAAPDIAALRNSRLKLFDARLTDVNRVVVEAPGKTRATLTAFVDELVKVVTEADGKVQDVLGENSEEQKALNQVLDVLRKAKDTDLIKDQQIAKDLQARINKPLPEDFAKSLKNFTGKDFKSVPELLDFLATDDSSLHEIRLELLKDWRRSLVEMRVADLDQRKAQLAALERELEITQRQLRKEVYLRLMPDDWHGSVFDELAALEKRFQSTKETSQIRALRTEAYNKIVYLSHYFERIGYLVDEERMAEHDSTVIEHRYSIVASRINAQAHERLISHGLDGLVSFAEGGIKYEDVAGVLRFIQTGLLGIIAGNTN